MFSHGKHLYLFGGHYTDTDGSWTRNLNDMWKYDTEDNMWTWIGGPNITNQEMENVPPVRRETSLFDQIELEQF